MKNKYKTILKTTGVTLGSLALIAGSFFAGRATKKVPQTAVEIFRTDNKAYLVRVYNPQDGIGKGLEITDRNDALDYSIIGTDSYLSREAFRERYPHISVVILDIDK